MIAGNRIFFTLSIFLILISGLLQKTQVVSFYGIKVNLILTLTLVLALVMDNYWRYLGLVFFASLLLKVGSGFNWESLVLVLVASAAFWAKKYSTGKPVTDILFLAVAGTAVFYALLDFGFLVSFPAAVLIEIIYNIAAAFIFYYFLSKFHVRS